MLHTDHAIGCRTVGLRTKLPVDMPPDRRTKISEKVVHSLRERGMVREASSASPID
jgi:hypothetical protein